MKQSQNPRRAVSNRADDLKGNSEIQEVHLWTQPMCMLLGTFLECFLSY